MVPGSLGGVTPPPPISTARAGLKAALYTGGVGAGLPVAAMAVEAVLVVVDGRPPAGRRAARKAPGIALVAMGIIGVRPRVERLMRTPRLGRSRKARLLLAPAMGAPLPSQERTRPRPCARALSQTPSAQMFGLGPGGTKSGVVPPDEGPFSLREAAPRPPACSAGDVATTHPARVRAAAVLAAGGSLMPPVGPATPVLIARGLAVTPVATGPPPELDTATAKVEGRRRRTAQVIAVTDEPRAVPVAPSSPGSPQG